MLHTLLGIETAKQLYLHPKLGISWEGFAIEEVIRSLGVENEDCHFWSTQSGVELDLLVTANGQKVGFEFKFTDSPKITKSINIAFQDLGLDKLTVIIPHEVEFPLANNISICGLERFVNRPNSN